MKCSVLPLPPKVNMGYGLWVTFIQNHNMGYGIWVCFFFLAVFQIWVMGYGSKTHITHNPYFSGHFFSKTKNLVIDYSQLSANSEHVLYTIIIIVFTLINQSSISSSESLMSLSNASSLSRISSAR